MKMLAFEFSSPQRGVAVVEEAPGAGCFLECESLETGMNANRPFELIQEVLKQAKLEREQIEGLAIGLGPGSYTGIRSAIALAQGWVLGLNVKLAGVSSAECLAAQAHAEGLRGRIAAVIDAQRGEFYIANYELGPVEWGEVHPLRLAAQSTVADCELKGELLVGPQITKWFPNGRTVFPRAATLAKLALRRARFTTADQLEPIYLRPTTFVKAPPPRIFPT